MEDLVPGDIVMVEAGDLVPADGRLVRAATLEIDESALTGESAPVPKQVDVVPADAALGDRVDLAFMNTQVTRGAGTILVTSTGNATEVGHISDMLQGEQAEPTPLTRQLNNLTNQILVIAGVALMISIGLGLWRDQPFDELLLTAVAFSVSAIPTGLPAVVTTILAAGTTTLAAAGAIVKRLRSVETLGSTSAINSDKTGTLTLNQMTATQMAVVGRRYSITGEGYSPLGQITHAAGQGDVPLDRYLLPMALCADAVARDGDLVGDPTEGALVVLAAKGGVDPVLTRERYPRLAEVPFDAAYKFMATFHAMKDDAGKDVIRCYVKGAPDQLLARATTADDGTGRQVPVETIREAYLAENERLGRDGLRVLATAQRDFDPATFDPNAELLPLVSDLTLLALVGIVDPPRAEARAAIATAHAAGIEVRMITGDHAVTAEAIARQLGITGRAITGAEFAAMGDEEVARQIDDIGVIARVAPEDKVHLVDVLKRKGHVVAMTGDGVNDAPALKRADIGVAMGITGTEVSKEAAVMILTDDNFATIVKAVELGRALYDNLVRYIRYQMAGLFGFIATFLGASLFFIAEGIPFTPLQTLWVNFTVTVFLAVGLGYGKAREGLMAEPPRSPEQRILPSRLFTYLIFIGTIMGICTLATIWWATDAHGEAVARTMGLTVFSLANIWFALETSDPQHSVFSMDLRDNPTLLKGAGAALLATIAAVELGILNRILGSTSLTVEQWVICVVVSLVVLIVPEVIKLLHVDTEETARPAPLVVSEAEA
jgi:Ca2+-transporting ATPase